MFNFNFVRISLAYMNFQKALCVYTKKTHKWLTLIYMVSSCFFDHSYKWSPPVYFSIAIKNLLTIIFGNCRSLKHTCHQVAQVRKQTFISYHNGIYKLSKWISFQTNRSLILHSK